MSWVRFRLPFWQSPPYKPVTLPLPSNSGQSPLQTDQIPLEAALETSHKNVRGSHSISPSSHVETREHAPTLYLGNWLAQFGADSLSRTNTTLQGKPKHSTSKPAKRVLAEASNAKRLQLQVNCREILSQSFTKMMC